jgi:hypothetical protein
MLTKFGVDGVRVGSWLERKLVSRRVKALISRYKFSNLTGGCRC